MRRAILAALTTVAAGVIVMSIFPEVLSFGILAAIAVMGAFIIYFNEKKQGG